MRWPAKSLFTLLAILGVLGLAYLAGKGSASDSNRGTATQSIAVTSYPVTAFKPSQPDLKQFGPLAFMGGLELRSKHEGFGGISAFRFLADGARFIAATDVGDWITGIVRREQGLPAALDEVVISPIMTAEGRRAKDVGLWDVESLALDSSRAALGIERDHSILTFEVNAGKISSGGKSIPVPGFVKAWPSNRGIEALGFMPASSPYPGSLVGFSERSSDTGDTSEAFVMKDNGSDVFKFLIRRSDRFDVTDLDFMPNGDLILLERFFSPLRGVGMRLRRIKTALIRPDAVIEPETLLSVDKSHAIDNMEGLSIHRGPQGEILFTIVSDDNFSIVQRNLLLQFRWTGE